MTQGSFRLALGVAALAAIWIIVYWWTPSAPRPSIAFQPPPQLPNTILDPQPSPADPAHADEPAPSKPKPGVTPPTFYQHKVARDDTAQSISKRYYGTSAQWQAVMRANPKTDFQHLRIGMTIRVPVDPKNIQGLADKPAPTDSDSTPATPGIDYVVEKGDTLTGLAFRFYGRASVYQWIIDANSEQLGADGSKIQPGMKIIIPPAPEGASRDGQGNQ